MEITVEPWKKLVIHEIIEYRFDDWLKQIAFGSRSVGGGIPTMNWANGIVFQAFHFPDADAIVQEKLNGILHWSSVIFAVKEKFEKQIVKDDGTINFIDVSVNDIFGKVAEYLKEQSKFIKSS